VPELKFYYIKSPQHLEVKVDGALGGPTPTGDGIVMSIYTERNAIPQVQVFNITDEGALGEELPESREGKVGVVRSVQTSLHLSLGQAKSIHDWLGKQIEQIEAGGNRSNDGG